MLHLSELLPLTYRLPQAIDRGITLERVASPEGFRWAIRMSGANLCLNKKGVFEYESMPSSRTEAFYRRCRWAAPEKALAAWDKLKDVVELRVE